MIRRGTLLGISKIIISAACMLLLVRCSRTPDPSAGDNVAPAAAPLADLGSLTISPQKGEGNDQVFHVVLTRKAGAAAPSMIGLLVNKEMLGGNACYVYGTSDGRLLLVNDSGNGSRSLPEGAADISNTQCQLLRSGSGFQLTPAQAIFDAHVRFHPVFTGSMKTFAIAYDDKQATIGLTTVGEWNISQSSR